MILSLNFFIPTNLFTFLIFNRWVRFIFKTNIMRNHPYTVSCKFISVDE